jgi:hypothetical protein
MDNKNTGLGKTLPKIDFSNPSKPVVQPLKRDPSTAQVGYSPNMLINSPIDESQS